MILYAHHISAHDQTMEGVFIFDERDPGLSNTIIAQSGRIDSNPEQMTLNLLLHNGSVHMVSKDLDSSKVLRFSSYNLKIELSDIATRLSSLKKGRKEMSLSELRRYLKETQEGTMQYNKAAIELHRKFSIPFACLLLGLIGMPLGLMGRVTGRSLGIALSIAVFAAYYMLLFVADSLGETGRLSPVLATWIPNVVLGTSTLILFLRTARDM
jgi:lipopolysaccharide export system permease protein